MTACENISIRNNVNADLSDFFYIVSENSIKIFPLGINSLTIEFGNEISEELNEKSINLANYFEKNPFEGLIETVPAYASLTIFYDISSVKKINPEFRTAFEIVKNIVETALKMPTFSNHTYPRQFEIPVDFSRESALDLDFVSSLNQLSPEKYIKLFTDKIYRVYMLGFLPGFAYMGEVDEKVAAPRKNSPRLVVPQGSIGIAGRQTGIYPFDSPGGWQIIGKTDFRLFSPDNENPCTLNAGDQIKFTAI